MNREAPEGSLRCSAAQGQAAVITSSRAISNEDIIQAFAYEIIMFYIVQRFDASNIEMLLDTFFFNQPSYCFHTNYFIIALMK